MSQVEPWHFIQSLASPASTQRRLAQVVSRALGSNFGAAARASLRAARQQQGARWPSLVDFAFGPNGLRWADLATELRAMNRAAIEAAVDAQPAEALRYATRIEKVLQDLSPTGQMSGLDEAAMRSLIGFRWPTLDQVIYLQKHGVDLAVEQARRMGVVADDIDDLFDIEGIASFSSSVVQRSGFEHGAVFEIRTLAWRLTEGVDKAKLRLQLPMLDGKLGPDIVEYLEAGARLFQAKALQDFGAMAAERATSAALDQLWSDVRRIGTQSMTVTDPTDWRVAGQGMDRADLSAVWTGEYTFVLDVAHLLEKTKNPIDYMLRFAQRHGDEIVGDVDVLTEMKLAADQMAEQLTDAFRALKDTGPLPADTQSWVMLSLRSRVEALIAEGRYHGDAAIEITDLTPELLLGLGLFTTADVLAHAGKTGEDLLRPAMAGLAGLTDEMVRTMPDVTVEFELIVDTVAHDLLTAL